MDAPFDPSGPASKQAGIFGLPGAPGDAALVFVPVPFDATTSYGQGASRAPAAMLAASHQVELYDRELGRPYERGLAMLDIPAPIVALNERALAAAALARAQGPQAAAAREAVNLAGAQMNEWVYQTCLGHLGRGQRIGLMGGDHSTPLGAILAHAQHHRGLSVLHIDAHCDLRPAYEGFVYSHASIMYNVLFAPRLAAQGPVLPTVDRLVQVGIRDFCEPEHRLIEQHPGRIKTFFDEELNERAFAGEPFVQTAGDIVDCLGDDVYVSLDIDGLEPAFCPHTGTPVPGGLHYRQVLALLRALTRSGRRLVGFDVNEVAPGPAGEEWDANVGARLLYKLAGHALASQPQARHGAPAGFRSP